MKNKFISTLLAVCFCIISAVPTGLLTVSAATYGDYEYTVSDGEVTITEFYSFSSDTTITIPSEINGYPVTTIGDYAFNGCDNLESIDIPNSVTYIGRGAFAWCDSLESIKIPDSVTTIGDYAFEGCEWLKNIEISASVTAIGESVLLDCYSLESIDVDTNNVNFTSENGVLFNKSRTTLFVYPPRKTDTSYIIPDSVTTIGDYAFQWCHSLESIEIPASVTAIGESVLLGCYSLESIDVDTNNVNFTSENGVLFNKSRTTLFVYPPRKTDTSYIIPGSVTTIGDYAFEWCENLENIQIPDSVTSIGEGAFDETAYYNDETNWTDGVLYLGNHLIKADWELPEQYTIPDGIKTIAGLAFEGCDGLESIKIPDSVTTIGDYAFSNCFYLSDVDLGSGVTTIGEGAFEGRNSLESIKIPDSVTSIGNLAFAYCDYLTNVTIGSGVTTIGEGAFDECYNIENVYYKGYEEKWNSIDIGVFNECLTQNVTFLDGDYTYKMSSGEVTIIGFNASVSGTITIPSEINGHPVTTIGDYAFEWCDGLESIVIPDSVATIGEDAFEWCDSLESIQIPDSVTSIGEGAFENTAYYNDETNWTDGVLYIGNHLIKADWELSGQYTIPYGIKTIADWAFNQCDSLESIKMPDSVTTIGDYAFRDCTSLADVDLGSGVTTIGERSFVWCGSLESIKIPDSVTSIGAYAFDKTDYYGDETNWTDGVLYLGNHLIEANRDISGEYIIPYGIKTIADLAFEGCDGLESIKIPDSVTTIGDYAFSACERLADVDLGSGVTTIGEGAFEGCYAQSIKIPDSVTIIGDYAFYACELLADVDLGSGVTTIGESAFDECYNIENVYYRGDEEKWNSIDIGDYNEYLAENVIFLEGNIYPTQTTVSADGKTFTVAVDSTEVGKTVILALYKGDSLADIAYAVYESEALKFTTEEEYDSALVYVWNSLSELSSGTNAEIVR